MSLKNILKRLFAASSSASQDSGSLMKKWMKNNMVKTWYEKGWLQEESPDVLAYMLKEWESCNAPVPPPHRVKSGVVEEFAKKYNYDTLVETGTFRGKMIAVQKNNFKKIISIEIDGQFYEDVKQKFKDHTHIHFYLGDSGKVLREIVAGLDYPVLFWLDAHYNHSSVVPLEKECPIYEEIDAIFKDVTKDHILLVDDARLFVGRNDYPTIDALSKYILSKRPDYGVEIKDDIIRVLRKDMLR